jgi:cation:H+ antiporter
MIIVYLLVLVIGFYALVKGADLFVDGSSNIARMLHVPGLIIGLTIVAFGTSAPELAVSTSAALQGANEIAVSNVVGSNLFNLLVVLGVCAVLKPIAVDRDVLRRDYPVSLGITGLALAITCESAFVINRGPQYMLAQGTSLLSTGERFLGIDMSQIVGTVSRIDGLVLVIMLYVFSAGTVHMTLLKNLTELNMNLNRLDRKVFIECLVMQRIKYADESLDYDEKPLMYDGCTVRLS